MKLFYTFVIVFSYFHHAYSNEVTETSNESTAVLVSSAEINYQKLVISQIQNDFIKTHKISKSFWSLDNTAIVDKVINYKN